MFRALHEEQKKKKPRPPKAVKKPPDCSAWQSQEKRKTKISDCQAVLN